MKKTCLLFLFFILTVAEAQNRRKIDSLLLLNKNLVGADTNKVKLYNALSYAFTRVNLDSSRSFANQALLLARQLGFNNGVALSYNSLGICFQQRGQYDSALHCYELSFQNRKANNDKAGMINSESNMGIVYSLLGQYSKAISIYENALSMQRETKDSSGIAYSFSRLATVYTYLSDYEKALQHYQQAQKILEKRKDNPGLTQIFNNTGIVYTFTGNLEKAIEYYKAALKVCEITGDKKSMCSSFNNLGSVYQKKKDLESALNYFNKSLEIARAISYSNGIAANLLNIGGILQTKKDFSSALRTYKQVLEIHEKSGNKREIAQTTLRIGALLLEDNNLAEAKTYLDRSTAYCKQLGLKDLLLENYSAFADLYKRKKDFKKSYDFLGLYASLKDSVLNEEKSHNMALLEARFETDKKENEIANLTKDKEIGILRESEQKATGRKQTIVLGISVAGVALVLVLVFIIFKGYRDKKKANLQLEEKNAAILAQKKILEEKNILVTDSIEYAKGIQETILPSQEEIATFLPGSFIFYKPKDIVAGDFYWLKKTGASSLAPPAQSLSLNEGVFLAACDCTGHGVPGAFMSMHSYYLLERIMKEKNVQTPAEILNELNEQMRNTLHQDKKDASAKYGIDMALIKFEKDHIQFSGARNPLLIIKNKELKEIKADRIYIGGSKERFTNHVLSPEKGSMLYMFTDGYADQKGGNKAEKFFASNFRELLKEISELTPQEQRNELERTFENWRGGIEQIDDVLVVGIRIT